MLFLDLQRGPLPAECPGPTIFTTEGDTIQINITNDLDEHHAFFIPGMFNSGPIAPGQTVQQVLYRREPGAPISITTT